MQHSSENFFFSSWLDPPVDVEPADMEGQLHFKKQSKIGAREMAEEFKTHAAFAEDLSWFLTPGPAVRKTFNSSLRESSALFCPP